MLQQLVIKNFVTIEQQTVSFTTGFNVITGETGAGKSLTLKALAFLFGEKLPASALKKETDPLSITGVFDLSAEALQFLKERDLPLEEETLVIRRVLTPDQKTRAYVNETPVPMALLKELRPHLFSLQNQFDQLLSPQAQLDLIDRAGNLHPEKTALEQAYRAWQEAEQHLTALKDRLLSLQKEKDFIESACSELDALCPQDNEEETLLENRQRAKSQGETLQILQECLGFLGAEDTLSAQTYKISKKLHKLSDLNLASEIQQKADHLSEAYLNLHGFLSDKLYENQHLGDTDIDALESRLHQLRAAARKHQCTVADLPEKWQMFQTQSHALTHSTTDLTAAEEAAETCKKVFQKASQTLFNARENAANTLLNTVQKELPALMLEKVCLKTELTSLPEGSWSSKGAQTLTILIRSNIDLPFTPLHQTASGGERSRLMLAFEKATAHLKACPTLFFDEIDKGVGGAVADSVGRCLCAIGEHHQVIAISHAPQVAALAAHHLLVDKTHGTDKTTSQILALSQESRLNEIARMLSGASITEETLSAARSLLSANTYAHP